MEIPTNRECVVLYKGDATFCSLSSTLVSTGWLGGQGVQWTTTNQNRFTLGPSTGQACGFLLNGSNEPSDQYTGLTTGQSVYSAGTFCAGNWLISTSTFEKYTWASRQVGPLVPIVYTVNDKLLFSLRGYWTNEDEWTLSGDPRAPNEFFVGFVSKSPSTTHLVIQTNLQGFTELEIFCTRDVTAHFKGDSYATAVHPDLLGSGWSGGQGAKWVDSTADEFMVGASDGEYCGFLIWGSDEISDQFTGQTGNQLAYGFVVVCSGCWFITVRIFEQYTWASRQAGPLVPLVYTPGEKLRFSLRGYWTNEDEWTASGDPRAPNNYFVGSVIQAPSTINDWRLVIQTTI